MRREFVVAAYIVDDRKVLLVNHKKLNKWLPIGGHIEPNELPDEAVLREAKEETGLKVEITSSNFNVTDSSVKLLNTPHHVQLENIDKEHQHIDLVYFCRLKSKNQKLNTTEECKWFSIKDLESIKDISPNTKYFAKLALSQLAQW